MGEEGGGGDRKRKREKRGEGGGEAEGEGGEASWLLESWAFLTLQHRDLLISLQGGGNKWEKRDKKRKAGRK